MPSSTTKAVFGLLGWSYVPDFITSTILRYARPYLRQPVTPWHYRITFALVVFSYLTYNLFEASLSTPPNFYELLGVLPSAEDSELKAAFRMFARRNHPDRVGEQGADLFVAVRGGYEALMEPNKRWAYDRFGAEILGCKECVTQRDYLARGMIQSLGFHIVSGLALLFFSAIGRSSSVAFWRYTLFLGHFASELSLLFSPSPSSPEYEGYSILSILFPTRLPFQHIRLLHQLFMFFSIAVSRVAPVLFPEASDDPSSPAFAQAAAVIVEKLKNIDREIYAVLSTQMMAALPLGAKRNDELDEHTLTLLTREMEDLVIESRLSAAPVGSDLGRARNEAVERFKTQVQEPPAPRRRTSSQRSIGSEMANVLPSPVSPVRKEFVDVIDVDALPDVPLRTIFNGRGSFNAEMGMVLAGPMRARSLSC